MRSIEQTAYHEAGHAVVSLELNRRFRYITVKPAADSAGHLAPFKSAKWVDRESYEVTARFERYTRDEVMIFLAGGIAARVKFPNHHGDRLVSNGLIVAGDQHEAANAASYLVSDIEIPHYLKWLRVRTQSLLSRPDVWVCIEGIAAELLQRETLKYGAALEVWRRARRGYFQIAPNATRAASSPA
jgi:hypothetical protein